MKRQINCRVWSQESHLGSQPSSASQAMQPRASYLIPSDTGFLVSKMGITSGAVRCFQCNRKSNPIGFKHRTFDGLTHLGVCRLQGLQGSWGYLSDVLKDQGLSHSTLLSTVLISFRWGSPQGPRMAARAVRPPDFLVHI